MPVDGRTSASTTSENAASEYLSRWPGLLSLVLGLLLGPVAALVNHGLIYIATPWACGHGGHAALHVIPAVCVLLAIGGGLLARADWTRVGRETEAPGASVFDRSRFLALCGLATSALSALLILTQWLAIVVFGPCLRA
jgi:hypothetical protein